MELSPDMKWMATGSEDGTVIVWELGNQSQFCSVHLTGVLGSIGRKRLCLPLWADIYPMYPTGGALDAGPPPTAGTVETMQDVNKGDNGKISKGVKRLQELKQDESKEEADSGGDGHGGDNTQAVRYPAEKLRIKMFKKRITGLAFTPGKMVQSCHSFELTLFEQHAILGFVK